MLPDNMRFRQNWRGKLILQISETHAHMRDLNGSGYYDQWTTLDWRDADFNDLIALLAASKEPKP